MNKFLKEKGIAILLLSVIFTFGTLFWTSDIVNNQNDLSSVDLGWPVDFVSQSFYQLDPPEWWFPKSMDFGNPTEYSIRLDLLKFTLSVFVNFSIIFNVFLFIFKLNPNLTFLRKIISVKYIAGAVALTFLALVSFIVFTDIKNQSQMGEGIPPPQVEASTPPAPQNIGEKGIYEPFDFYKINDDTVYYYNKEIAGVDVATFQVLEDHWAKDKNYVYREGVRQTYLDPETVKVLPRTYVVDKAGVWVYGTGYYMRVDKTDADPATFSVISHGYGRDSNNVYYFAEKIIGADVASFELLRGIEYPSSEGLASNWYAKDKNNVYYRSSVIQGADARSLIFLGHEYAKDKNKVYYNGKVLTDADANSFALIGGYYTKDKDHVFSDGEILNIEIDPASFATVGGNVIKDNQRVYFRDYYNRSYDLVLNVDAPTFEHVGACKCVEMSCGNYFKDKNRVFLESKPVDSLDVASFQYFGPYSGVGGEVPYSTSYTKDRNAVYYACGEILEGADQETFSGLSDGYAKDKNAVWYFAETMGEADVATFQSLDKGYAKDKNNIYLYGEITNKTSFNKINQ